MEFTYLGDRVSVSGGCEADVGGLSKLGREKKVNLECGELLYGMQISSIA